MLGEDVEDESAAVEYLDGQQLLERTLLVGRELIVRHEEGEAGLLLGHPQLLRLALPQVPVGVDVAAVLPLRADDLGAGRVGQAGQLGERILGRPALVMAALDGDEEGSLERRGEVDEIASGHGSPA
jgi:hypothetical protein